MTDTWKSGAEHAQAYFDECMELRAEIKRLRAEIEVMRQSRAQVRAEMKEECARVAEATDTDALHCVGGHDRCNDGPFDGCPYCENRSPVAAAIRTLKSNTGG